MQDELLLGGEQRKTASTGSINSPTAASGWSRGTPPALLARPAQKSERLQCLDACRGLNVALMILVDNIGGWCAALLCLSPLPPPPLCLPVSLR